MRRMQNLLNVNCDLTVCYTKINVSHQAEIRHQCEQRGVRFTAGHPGLVCSWSQYSYQSWLLVPDRHTCKACCHTAEGNISHQGGRQVSCRRGLEFTIECLVWEWSWSLYSYQSWLMAADIHICMGHCRPRQGGPGGGGQRGEQWSLQTQVGQRATRSAALLVDLCWTFSAP